MLAYLFHNMSWSQLYFRVQTFCWLSLFFCVCVCGGGGGWGWGGGGFGIKFSYPNEIAFSLLADRLLQLRMIQVVYYIFNISLSLYQTQETYTSSYHEAISNCNAIHDNAAVLPCAKFHSNHFTTTWMGAEWIFHQIWNIIWKKNLCEMDPRSEHDWITFTLWFKSKK